MVIEQIYTNCLAQGAYYITSGGEAAIIDPLRDVAPYLERIARDGVQLKYIFETHFHADFVSGHIDLQEKTKASIVFGPNANPSYEAIISQDEQIFRVGKITIQVLYTPGHTLESACFLLSDEAGKKVALFSGDTLFLGDVGRPDLAQKAAHLTQEDLAGMLYESIQNKIMPLEDDLIIYPAHGAGSACGKNMMKETVDTLGNQKRMNYALNQPNKESFIRAVLDGLAPPPIYFGMNVNLNKNGNERIETVLKNGLKPLSVKEFEDLSKKENVQILDVRTAAEFAQGFIPQSMNIGIKGDFAPWVGALIGDVKTPILLVTQIGEEEETITRLARIGFDHVLGFLEGGFQRWESEKKAVQTIQRISATDFLQKYSAENSQILDVRKESEFENNHLENALSKPLANISVWVSELNPTKKYFVHCAGGYRSMIAASILKAKGIDNLEEVDGGFAAISKEKSSKPLVNS